MMDKITVDEIVIVEKWLKDNEFDDIYHLFEVFTKHEKLLNLFKAEIDKLDLKEHD